MSTKNFFFFTLVTVLSTTINSCNTTDKQVITSNNDPEKITECNCQDLFLDELYSHFYLEDRTKPYTGHCTGLDEKGNTYIEKDYIGGKLHGTIILYYENGTIKEETQFDKNFQHGESKKYDESGKLISHKEYHKGEFKKNLLQ